MTINEHQFKAVIVVKVSDDWLTIYLDESRYRDRVTTADAAIMINGIQISINGTYYYLKLEISIDVSYRWGCRGACNLHRKTGYWIILATAVKILTRPAVYVSRVINGYYIKNAITVQIAYGS